MTSVPADLKYSAEHEWLRDDDGNVRVGITEFAQEQLGDIVYVELPPVGQKLTSGKAFGVVESVKAASDLYSPMTGTVVEVNEQLLDEPELVNTDPYGDGWMMLIEAGEDGETVELIDAAAYEKLLAEEE